MLKIFRISLTIFIALIISHCGLKKPGVDPAFVNPEVDHTRFTSQCITCHVDMRPITNDPVVHGYERDCAECHRYDPTTLWRPYPFFLHVPEPTDCLACHAIRRPRNDTHPPAGDCYLCHRFPQWDPPIAGQ